MPGAVLGPGWLHTSGNQILDDANRPVRILGVGWQYPGQGNHLANFQKMRDGGFNACRVYFRNSIRDEDLFNIDNCVAAAKQTGMKVIIDNHTNNPGHGDEDNWGAQQKNGLWYDLGGASDGTDGGGNVGQTTDAKWVSDWAFVANKYKNEPTVCAFDLRNEPLAYFGMCTWEAGSNNPNQNLRWAYQRAAQQIQAAGYQGLIICEGPQNYGGSFGNKGPAPWGDLTLAQSLPVTTSTYQNKIVYSIHDYPNDVMGVSPDSGPQKVSQMNQIWGYLVTGNIAPVWIGEMGSNFTGWPGPQSPTGAAWIQTLDDYCNGRLSAQGGPTFSGSQQGIGINWWAWGNLEEQPLNGTLDPNGNFRSDQYAAWNKFAMVPVTGVPAGTTESPNYTQVTNTTGSITDSTSNRWTLTADARVGRNGTADARTSNVVRLAYVDQVVWQQNSGQLWWYWRASDDTWQPDPGTTTSPLPAESPDGTTITLVSHPAIINVAGETVTLTSTNGGQIVFNGVSDASTNNVVKIVYHDHLVYYLDTSGVWRRKARSTDVWVTTTDPFPANPGGNVTAASVQAAIDAVIADLQAIRTDVGYLSP